MYTTHHPCWDAKNRDGLSDVLPFDYSNIAYTIEAGINNSDKSKVSTTEVKGKVEEPVQNPIEEIDRVIDTASPQPEKSTTVNHQLPAYIPKALADLMTAKDVSEEDIQLVVTQKGYYPEDTSIANYDPEFIDGCLIGAWDKVYKIIETNKDLPF